MFVHGVPGMCYLYSVQCTMYLRIALIYVHVNRISPENCMHAVNGDCFLVFSFKLLSPCQHSIFWWSSSMLSQLYHDSVIPISHQDAIFLGWESAIKWNWKCLSKPIFKNHNKSNILKLNSVRTFSSNQSKYLETVTKEMFQYNNFIIEHSTKETKNGSSFHFYVHFHAMVL